MSEDEEVQNLEAEIQKLDGRAEARIKYHTMMAASLEGIDAHERDKHRAFAVASRFMKQAEESMLGLIELAYDAVDEIEALGIDRKVAANIVVTQTLAVMFDALVPTLEEDIS